MTRDGAIDFDQRVKELGVILKRRFDTQEKEWAASSAAVCSTTPSLKPHLMESIRKAIELFSGLSPLTAKPLVLVDDEGEVYQPDAEVEFDAFVSDGRKFLVDVKWYAEMEDVYHFARKAAFAERRLGQPVEKVLLTLGIDPRAADLAERLGMIWYAATIE